MNDPEKWFKEELLSDDERAAAQARVALRLSLKAKPRITEADLQQARTEGYQAGRIAGIREGFEAALETKPLRANEYFGGKSNAKYPTATDYLISKDLL